MRDDAVAPVIAVMLILAALVTFLAVFNGIYIPSLKQSAEIDHLAHVEEAFYRFSSDLSFAITSGKDGLSFTEPVQMGGGDVVFNPLKSGGSLSVRAEEVPVYRLMLYNESGGVVDSANGTMVAVAYEPQGNFWQDQGYRWQYGYLNVTKYGSRKSPLGYDTADDVSEALDDPATPVAAFARSFGSVQGVASITPVQNETPRSDNRIVFSVPAGTCSGLVLRAASMNVSPGHAFTSGNGYGTLALTANVTPVTYAGVRWIAVSPGTTGSGPGAAFGNATLQGWNATFSSLNATTCRNTLFFTDTGDGTLWYGIDPADSASVTLEKVTLLVSAS
jgi:hypothetical protein